MRERTRCYSAALILALAACGLWAAHGRCAEPGAPLPLTRVLPEHTLVYLHVPARASRNPEGPRTALAQVTGHPQVQAFLDEVDRDKAAILEAVLCALLPQAPLPPPARSAAAAARREQAGKLADWLDSLDGELTLAVPGLSTSTGRPLVAVQVRLRDEVRAAVAAGRLHHGLPAFVRPDGEGGYDLLAPLNGALRVAPGRLVVVLGGGRDDLAALEQTPNPALADLPLFGDALSRTRASAEHAFLFVRVRPLVEAFASLGEPRVKTMLAVSGLEGAEYLALGGRTRQDGRVAHTLSLSTPDGPTGLLAALQNRPDPAAQAALAPHEADCFVAIHLDLDGLWERIAPHLQAGAPELAARWEQALQDREAASGLSVREQIGQAFTGSISLFPARERSAPRLYPPDSIVHVPVRDASLARQCLADLRQATGPGAWRTTECSGIPVLYRLPPGGRAGVAPALALTDESLWIAAYPHVLARYLARAEENGLAASPGFQAALASVEGDPAAAVAYLRTSHALPALYRGLACALHAATAVPGFEADPAVLPPATDLGVAWTDTTVTVVRRPEGVALVAVGPAGLWGAPAWAGGHFADLFRGPGGVVRMAAVAGILGHARAERRAEERRATVRARLQAIHAAWRTCVRETGHPPAGWQDLFEPGGLRTEAAVCPERENAHRRFVLVPAPASPAAARPLAHEPLDTGREHVWILFADGRVKRLTRARARRILESVSTEPVPASEPHETRE